MSSLTLTDISKRFDRHQALDGVSLKVDSGEFVCLLGASGCGKTTLLRIIAGLEMADSGDIRLGDTDLLNVPCHQRQIGMVFQSLALFPHLNVSDNVSYGLKMREQPIDVQHDRAKTLLDMVGLSGFQNRKISSLSGGQRQRVAIARALALEPNLFLMDEPFSALDAGLRDHLQAELKQLQQSLGITTVFVTHDQREAMALADKIVVLNNGVVEQSAAPAEIYARPMTRFVAEFIGENNLLNVCIDKNTIKLGETDLGAPDTFVSQLPGSCVLSVRPESIRLHRVTEPKLGLRGKISHCRQIGAIVERRIDTDTIQLKQVELYKTNDPFSAGDDVVVSFDWAQVWPLPQSTPTPQLS